MPNHLIQIIDYLDEHEAKIVKTMLSAKGIQYIANGHGGASKYQSYYFKISVSHLDQAAASKIIAEFKASQKVKKNRCPKCNSGIYEPAKDLNIFQKILYLGTTPVRCKKCKTLFGI